MQMAPDNVQTYLIHYTDPHHKSIIIVQTHLAVTLALKSSVRVIFASRDVARSVGNHVRFYYGFSSFDYGYLKCDGVKLAYQVI